MVVISVMLLLLTTLELVLVSLLLVMTVLVRMQQGRVITCAVVDCGRY